MWKVFTDDRKMPFNQKNLVWAFGSDSLFTGEGGRGTTALKMNKKILVIS